MSRNQAGFFIRKGRVCVNGEVLKDPNAEVEAGSEVTFDNKPIAIPAHQYLLLHKPAAYICAAKDAEHPSVLALLGDFAEDNYYYFANTLGAETTGLVLISDDVRWTHRIKPRLQKAKRVYEVTTTRDLSEDEFQRLQLSCATPTEGAEASIDNVERRSDCVLSITLSEGGGKGIHALFGALNIEIESLCLRQLGRLDLADLPEGEYQEIDPNQIKI